MSKKSIIDLEEYVANLRKRLDEAENELNVRKQSQIARAAMMLAKTDPVFAAALNKAMGIETPRA